MKSRPFLQRAPFARNGVGSAWRRKNSFRTQIAPAAPAIVSLILLRPAIVWRAVESRTVAARCYAKKAQKSSGASCRSFQA